MMYLKQKPKMILPETVKHGEPLRVFPDPGEVACIAHSFDVSCPQRKITFDMVALFS